MKRPMDISMSYTAIPTEHYETMKAIVQTIATEDVTYYDDIEDRCCPFCHGSYDPSEKLDRLQHEEQCEVMKARDLISTWAKK